MQEHLNNLDGILVIETKNILDRLLYELYINLHCKKTEYISVLSVKKLFFKKLANLFAL